MREESNLAGPVLDDNVTVLADSASLLRIGFGSSGIRLRFEVMLFVRHGWQAPSRERRETVNRSVNRREKELSERRRAGGGFGCREFIYRGGNNKKI